MPSRKENDVATAFRTTCVMDCPDLCSLEVSVSEGRVERIRGAREGLTDGFICSKIGRFGQRVHHPDRLLHPMRRVGPKGEGRFERIAWPQALDAVAKGLEETSRRWGAEAVLPYHYGGSNGFMAEDSLDELFFARLGASRLDKTLCAAPTGTVAKAMYGKMPGVAFEDYPQARFILIWGANPKASNIHLVPKLREAKRNGAFIVSVDPQRHFSPGEVDLHLPIYPGADLALALALVRHFKVRQLLDRDFLERHCSGLEEILQAAEEWTPERAAGETRLPASDIEELAERYAGSSPAVLRCGWGPERNRNGGQAIAAILALPALLGKFGVRGGGFTLSNSGAVGLDLSRLLGSFQWNSRRLNMSRLGDILNSDLDPPVRALFIYNCNPAASAPDQNAVVRGLAREDVFTIVHEQVMTDTARYADILLPATTFLEQREIRRGYGNYRIGGCWPLIEPAGESKPNDEVFALLGRRMGFRDEPFRWDSEQFMQKVGQALKMPGGGPDAEGIAALEQGLSLGCEFPGSAPVQFGTVFPATGDRKVQLQPAELGQRPYRFQALPLNGYPLALISPASSKLINSTLGEFNLKDLTLMLHPADASQRKLSQGDRVRVFNSLGEVVCGLRVSESIAPGVACLPKGAWMKSSLNGRTSTALCPGTVSSVGGGACFNDARVEVERA